MNQQHLHNRLGNAIGETKKRMFQRLKANLDLRSATALFMEEIRQDFADIVKESESSEAPTQLENLIS